MGYGYFRSASGTPVPHRLLPLTIATVVVDPAAQVGLVTGPRSTPLVDGQARWAHGVSIGLTPAGVTALLGVPMRVLAQGAVPLPDLIGRRALELADRLGEAPDWPTRLALLDDQLSGWVRADQGVDRLAVRAWWCLQQPADRQRVGTVADELGVSRRGLERALQRQIGLSPGAVARIARFQRAVHMLFERVALPRAAVGCGYADQPHLNREFRGMAGVTPTELFAFFQYAVPAAG